MPIFGCGPVSIIPRGSTSLPVIFGMLENYRTESILFDVMEIHLPFNAIIGRQTLYQFMVVAPLWVPGPEDAIAQQHHQDPWRPHYPHFCAGEAPDAGGNPRGCCWPRGARPGTIELVPMCLILCTPRAALRQRGCSHEGHPDRCRCHPDYPHHREPGGQIGTCARHLPLGQC
jgi:hypothetical protein